MKIKVLQTKYQRWVLDHIEVYIAEQQESIPVGCVPPTFLVPDADPPQRETPWRQTPRCIPTPPVGRPPLKAGCMLGNQPPCEQTGLQKCIPVRCVPSAAVAISWGVSAQGGVCQTPPLDRMTDVCENNLSATTVADGKKHYLTPNLVCWR